MKVFKDGTVEGYAGHNPQARFVVDSRGVATDMDRAFLVGDHVRVIVGVDAGRDGVVTETGGVMSRVEINDRPGFGWWHENRHLTPVEDFTGSEAADPAYLSGGGVRFEHDPVLRRFDGLVRDVWAPAMREQERATELAERLDVELEFWGDDDGVPFWERPASPSGDFWEGATGSVFIVGPPDPTRVRVLHEAAELIAGDRDKDYGPPEVNFRRIADIWQVQFPERQWTPADVARAMIGLKLARTPEGHKRDTLVDIAGYAAIGVELEEV